MMAGPTRVLSDRRKAAGHEQQTWSRGLRSQQKRRKGFSQEMRAGDIDIPGQIPALTACKMTGSNS